jgi:transcriptional regulator with XRE-family HTH domain
MNKIHLAKCIAKKRHEMNITQEELASYIGVSKAAVSKWESENSLPDITLLPRLASYFNISIDELIGYEPQLTKEEIRRQYLYFKGVIGTKPFLEVQMELDEKIKKYYSCFPFLLQMTVLLMNHANAVERSEDVLMWALTLARRVKDESEDINDVKTAVNFEVILDMMLGKPNDALELLDESVRPLSQETESLAQVYQMLGEKEKAKRVYQISIYQHLLTLVAEAAQYSMLYEDNKEKSAEIITRSLKIAGIFQVSKLQPNAVAPVYYSAALLYCIQGEMDKSIEMLEQYTKICIEDFFPFSLHGDSYFDLIDDWFLGFDIGNGAPQNEKFIRKSMLSSVKDNPAFHILRDDVRYKNIIRKLESLVKEGGK